MTTPTVPRRALASDSEGARSVGAAFLHTGGGLASFASGLLLFGGHLLDLRAPAGDGSVAGSALALAAHALLVFALVAIYDHPRVRRDANGWLAATGMTLAVLGTVLTTAVVLVETAGASGVPVAAVLDAPVVRQVADYGPLAFFVGLILVGLALLPCGVRLRAAGIALVGGDLVFATGGFVGAAGPLVYVVGAAITGAGLITAGAALLSARERGAVDPAAGAA